MRRTTLVIAAIALATAARAQTRTIAGTVSAPDARGPIRLFALPFASRGRRSVAPSKVEVLAAAAGGPAIARTTAGAGGRFELATTAGPQAVFGYRDLDRDGRWDPATPEPFGWYATRRCGHWAAAPDGTGEPLAITLRAPTPFPRGERSVEGGQLCWRKGRPVLRLSGDAHRRGYAQGFLIARQILDFFRFYLLEDKLGSATAYLEEFAPFLESHLAPPAELVAECDAILEGMRASGADLTVPELGRPFSRTDLLAINSYIETRAMRSSCTQFAAWGERTAGTDAGGMITGRNMDGECDLRKVTVSHFVLFAVEPAAPGRKRYVSAMWPGFVGTLSGLNEDGFYAMENAGTTGPGPVVSGLVPISWTLRESLVRLGADAGPAAVTALCDELANSAGGACGPGCVILFATPFAGGEPPAFVLEGDRFGAALRLPGAVRPHLPDVLLCSNHHLLYGRDPHRPGTSFGVAPSFSSRWRYEAGMQRLEAWTRTGRKIGTAEMRELLQTVAHSSTEYAVITRPDRLELDVATASLESEPWDAPYRTWTSFAFEDLFRRPDDDHRGRGGNDRP